MPNWSTGTEIPLITTEYSLMLLLAQRFSLHWLFFFPAIWIWKLPVFFRVFMDYYMIFMDRVFPFKILNWVFNFSSYHMNQGTITMVGFLKLLSRGAAFPGDIVSQLVNSLNLYCILLIDSFHKSLIQCHLK